MDERNVPCIYTLIPCAGLGVRAGSLCPKQYQTIAGRPLVLHTLSVFLALSKLRKTVVVVAPEDTTLAAMVTENTALSIAYCGGDTRAKTVFNGLNWLLKEGASANDWVLVHDAARCLIRSEHILGLIDTCLSDGIGGLLAVPLSDTLKQAHGDRSLATVSRQDKWLAQTPQMFRIGSLLEAIHRAGHAVTDEAGAMEAMGWKPRLVPGSAQNFKVTFPEDFGVAEAVLRGRDGCNES